MTKHIDETLLIALRDEETVDADAWEHLSSCASCRASLTDARRRAEAMAELLSPSGPAVDVAAAKRAVRRRLRTERRHDGRRTDRFRHLRRAAAVLLVSAGAAYAIPRSPIPAWLGLGDPVPVEPAAPVVESPASGGTAEAQEVLVVAVTEGIDIVIRELPPGTEVRMVWLAGTNAQIAAGPGARYTAGEGRVAATAPVGPIRMGIPRSASSITISLNGRMVYRGTSAEAETAEVARFSDQGFVFLVPGAP
ncbi:MAG TPA: hypothetical protein VK858_08845 [Longimicrobiales bacterium]|nr:hypothetical protein [Longimicrobiales bacterium]